MTSFSYLPACILITSDPIRTDIPTSILPQNDCEKTVGAKDVITDSASNTLLSTKPRNILNNIIFALISIVLLCCINNEFTRLLKCTGRIY